MNDNKKTSLAARAKKRPLFTGAVLAFLAALAAGAINLIGDLFPPVEPITDTVAPIVQDAIQNAPARDDEQPTP